jgi:hypothetical protein
MSQPTTHPAWSEPPSATEIMRVLRPLQERRALMLEDGFQLPPLAIPTFTNWDVVISFVVTEGRKLDAVRRRDAG